MKIVGKVPLTAATKDWNVITTNQNANTEWGNDAVRNGTGAAKAKARPMTDAAVMAEGEP